MKPSLRNLLFVCGAPRSGTTAMHSLLTGDERIVLGMERYGAYLGSDFGEGLFNKERFFEFDKDPRDKTRGAANYLIAAARNFDAATYIGDKIPLLYLAHQRVSGVFPNARYIVILRNIFDICNSYKSRKENPKDDWSLDIDDAVQHWNQLLAFISSKKNDPQIHVVLYEDFFTDSAGYKKLYQFLGFDFDEHCEARYINLLEKTKKLEDRRAALISDVQKLGIFKTANLGMYQSLLEHYSAAPALTPQPVANIAKAGPVMNVQDVMSAQRIFLGNRTLTDSEINAMVGLTGQDALSYFLQSKEFQEDSFNGRLIVEMAKVLGIDAKLP